MFTQYFMTFEEATTPSDTQVLTNRWWVVHPDKGILFAKFGDGHYAPQCNHQQKIAEYIQKDMYPDLEVRHMPVVFLGSVGKANESVDRRYEALERQQDVY